MKARDSKESTPSKILEFASIYRKKKEPNTGLLKGTSSRRVTTKSSRPIDMKATSNLEKQTVKTLEKLEGYLTNSKNRGVTTNAHRVIDTETSIVNNYMGMYNRQNLRDPKSDWRYTNNY